MTRVPVIQGLNRGGETSDTVKNALKSLTMRTHSALINVGLVGIKLYPYVNLPFPQKSMFDMSMRMVIRIEIEMRKIYV